MNLSDDKRLFLNRDNYGNFDANVHFLSLTCEMRSTYRILEIGSGKGRLLNHYYKQGYDICGIEINSKTISESRQSYGKLPLQKVSSTLLPFDDDTFNVIVSMDVFEHIPDSDQHLKEVWRVLKPGGCYLLQTPNKWTNMIFETIRWKSLTKWRTDHCSLHSFGQIKRRFRKHGFKVEFFNVPIVTPFFKRKVKTYTGAPGLWMLKILNIDRLPLRLKTNFYIKCDISKSSGWK